MYLVQSIMPKILTWNSLALSCESPALVRARESFKACSSAAFLNKAKSLVSEKKRKHGHSNQGKSTGTKLNVWNVNNRQENPGLKTVYAWKVRTAFLKIWHLVLRDEHEKYRFYKPYYSVVDPWHFGRVRIRIRIRGSVRLTNGSESAPDPGIFVSDLRDDN